VGVSAAGVSACAKTSDERGNVTNVNISISTAPERIRNKGLDFLMGNSPVQAIKAMIKGKNKGQTTSREIPNHRA
jgi:hypothetical protein